jgi:hypothetical protein
MWGSNRLACIVSDTPKLPGVRHSSAGSSLVLLDTSLSCASSPFVLGGARSLEDKQALDVTMGGDEGQPEQMDRFG